MSDNDFVSLFTKAIRLVNVLAIEYCKIHIDDFQNFVRERLKEDKKID